MQVNKTTLSTRPGFNGFSAIPNDFVKNKKISVEAKGTAAFLQSFPPDWKIHPEWVQESLGYGERVWRRIAKELIEHGCLLFHKGGKLGGSFYTFDLWNKTSKEAQNKPVATTTKCRRRQNSDNDKMSSHSNNIIYINKQNNINNNNYTNHEEAQMNIFDPKDDVVVFWKTELMKAGMAEKVALGLLGKYDIDRIKQKLDMLAEASPHFPAKWLYKAIIEDYKPAIKNTKTTPTSSYTYGSPQETQKMLSERDKWKISEVNRSEELRKILTETRVQ